MKGFVMLQKGSSFSLFLSLWYICVWSNPMCKEWYCLWRGSEENVPVLLSFSLYLSPLRKGHLLNLKLGWHLASPRNPVSTALSTEVIGQQSNAQIFVGAEIQTHILICVQQVLFPTEPSPCPHLHSF